MAQTNSVVLRVGTAALLLILSADIHAQSPKPVLQLKDIFDLQFASDPQVSPDGKRVIYVRNSMDIMKDRQRSQLWIIGSDGADHRPLSSGERNDSMPRWAPDGKRLAFVSRTGDKVQLVCRWLDTGAESKIADVAAVPAALAWSPDSKTVAYAVLVPEKVKPFVELPAAPPGAQWADPPKVIRKTAFRFDGKGYLKDGFQQVFVVSAEGSTPRQLTSGPFHHGDGLVWAPDGKALLFSANRRADWELEPLDSEIHEVALADGSIRSLTKRFGPDHSPAVSPDGKTIAYVGFDDKRQGHQVSKLYLMDRATGESRAILAELDRDVKNPVWTTDGIYFQFDAEGTTHIGHLPDRSLDGKRIADHVGGVTLDRPYSSGSFSAAGGTVAFTYSTPDHPAELAVVQGKDAKAVQITNISAGLLGQRALARTEEIRYKSSHDGRIVHGWLVKPPGFDPKKKYPLILEIHGGPFANYGPRFGANMQLFAAAGYVVLYVNPRGSTSYGQEFGNLIHHNYPGNDYDDLMSGVDHVLKMGFIDADNLFVTGGSGGGILSAWIIGKTGRFRAAVVGKPVINWYSFVLTADIYPFFNRYWFPGYPWDNAEHYLKRSPISLAGKITTPTMILTGEEDHRTPMSESEQLYQALKLRQVDAMLVRIPGASHNIAARPSQLMAQVAYTLKWFETHRK